MRLNIKLVSSDLCLLFYGLKGNDAERATLRSIEIALMRKCGSINCGAWVKDELRKTYTYTIVRKNSSTDTLTKVKNLMREFGL